MDTISQFKELGIALASIIIFAYIVKYVIDKNEKVFQVLMTQLQNNRTDYTNFVETNNHGNSERIEKSTEAMTKVAGAIETHTRVLEKLLDKLQK